MHAAALQLFAPILAAEKSKTPFYIVGGVLVVWALVLSLGIGLRRPNFPGNLRVERIVITISVALVAATVASAVLTSGSPSTHPAVTKDSHVELPYNEPEPTGLPASNTSSTAAPASSTTSTAAAPATAPIAGGHSLALAANPGGALEYNTKSLSAKAGKVTITMANMSPLEHNVTVEQSGKILGATPTFTGGTRSVTLSLKPGTYKFYCSVPGHRQAGMEGTLSVS